MEKIDIYNLYDYVTYEYENNCLKIMWDSTNPVIQSLMILEKQPYFFTGETIKYSCGWITELKKHISWIKGTSINIHIIYHRDGRFWVKVFDEKPDCIICEKIDENGYLLSAVHSFYDESFNYTLQRCDCVYNDVLDDEENQPYIFK